MSVDAAAASARNTAAWHEASIAPMGVKSHRTPGLWYREPMHRSIYETAFVLARRAEYPGVLDDIAAMVDRFPVERIGVYETFYELDLKPLGFEKWRNEVWMWRPAGPSPDVTPRELTVERVATESALAELVTATAIGMGVANPPEGQEWRNIHHPATLRDERMHYFAGRVDGQVVTVSLSYVTETEVGVYGVATLPEFRRKGYAGAITRAAMLAEPRLPAAIAPSPEAYSVYYQLGFRYAGEFNRWRRNHPG